MAAQYMNNWKSPLVIKYCDETSKTQKWYFDATKGVLYLGTQPNSKCVTYPLKPKTGKRAGILRLGNCNYLQMTGVFK